MQSHLSQERRYASPSFRGQQGPDRRRQIAHRGIQANAPGQIALRSRFSAIRPVSSIYERQCEWEIELLFRWLKQHLKLRSFLGTSANAVKLQIYAAMIAYILLRLAAKAAKTKFDILRFTELVGLFLFDRRWLVAIDTPPPTHPSKKRDRLNPNQLAFRYA